jgi:hypothetical protein
MRNNKIYPLLCLSILYILRLQLAFSSASLEEQEFYSPDTNTCASKKISEICTTTQAFYVKDTSILPPQIIAQTLEFMDIENNFRRQAEEIGKNVGEDINIAQLCFHAFYKDGSHHMVERFSNTKCAGSFYLSGNDPIMYQGTPSRGGIDIDLQTIKAGENRYFEIRQRRQPILASLEFTVDTMINADTLLQNRQPEPENDLVEAARRKKQEIAELQAKKLQVIQDLEASIIRRKALINSEPPVLSNVDKKMEEFNVRFIGKIIEALKKDDYIFFILGRSREHEHVNFLLDSLKKEISNRKLSEVFNSKYFNLGCSEPLLYYDITDTFQQDTFRREIKKNKKTNNLEKIFIHLHSTKTPCKSCLLSSCTHTTEGIINHYREQLRSELKIDELPVYFIISYQKAYRDDNDYKFNLPIIKSLNPATNKLLIFNVKKPINNQLKIIKG